MVPIFLFQDLRGYSDFCKLQNQPFGLETCTCCRYSCCCFWSLVSSLSWEVLLEQLWRWVSISGQPGQSGSRWESRLLFKSASQRHSSLITTLGPQLLFARSFSLAWTIASFSTDFSTSNLPFVPAQMLIFSHNWRSSHYSFDSTPSETHHCLQDEAWAPWRVTPPATRTASSRYAWSLAAFRTSYVVKHLSPCRSSFLVFSPPWTLFPGVPMGWMMSEHRFPLSLHDAVASV